MDIYRLFVPSDHQPEGFSAALNRALDSLHVAWGVVPAHGWHGRQDVHVITVAGGPSTGGSLVYLGRRIMRDLGLSSLFMDRTGPDGYHATLATIGRGLYGAQHDLGLHGQISTDPTMPEPFGRPLVEGPDMSDLKDADPIVYGIEYTRRMNASGGIEYASTPRMADVGPRKPFTPDLASDHVAPYVKNERARQANRRAGVEGLS